MASTNKTPNYELSQFIGTDKPAWLADYNSDMNKIDLGIKDASTTATSAQGAATVATTSIGELSNLATTEKTNLVGAVNEVNSKAETAQGTASSASTSATSANVKVDDLIDYFNLNTINEYRGANLTITGGGTLRTNSSYIKVVRNSAGSLCKIYGAIVIDSPTANTQVKVNVDTGLRPSSQIAIENCGLTENFPNSYGLGGLRYVINTDGTIDFTSGTASGVTTSVLRPIACLVFVENFND